MASDAYENKDRPFTVAEKAKLLLLALLVPWILGPIFLLVAFFRTFPDYPKPWFGFWLLEATLAISYIVIPFTLFDRPRILRERMNRLNVKSTDSEEEKMFSQFGIIIAIISIIVMPLDAVGTADFPVVLNYTGSLLMILSFIGMVWVFRVNQFASKIVYRQEGHQLITTGPYGLVRHPMYAACIPLMIGFTLCLGSFWGLVPMAQFIVLVAIRTIHEEAFLVDTFGVEYQKYRARVQYKMAPFIF